MGFGGSYNEPRSARGGIMADRTRTRPAGTGQSWWVRHQHQDVTVIEGRERPSAEASDGERAIAISGPYSTREAAQKRRDAIYSRTLRALTEGAV